jgi:hypothetical protein
MNVSEGTMAPSLFVWVKLRVGEYHEAKRHFESNERLGNFCVLRRGKHVLQIELVSIF